MQLATAIRTIEQPECTAEVDLDRSVRDDLIKLHLPLVTGIAHSIRCSSLGRGIELDDLLAYGAKGLLDAATRFDAAKGVAFSTFARHRIRGAIVDGIRTQHWVSRRVYKRLREEEARAAQAPDGPSQIDSATTPGLRVPASSRGGNYEHTALTTGWTGARWNGRTMANLPVEEDETLKMAVASQLRFLPDLERRLLELFYFEGKDLTQAGAVLGLQRSWASRLHARALEALRAALE
ncbi:MAG TPA: sigma-70 family RNA polymerase sigma factor [Polyangia bacterium]|nr:sigma-70 family RNA polymerase sigma factor [Polyangia bacterium]